MMPTGISMGLNSVREIVSLIITSAAPKTIAPGTSNWCLVPSTRRMMCGTINPTKPSSPTTLTALAASSAAIAVSRSRLACTFMPTPRATSSPSTITSSCRVTSSDASNVASE